MVPDSTGREIREGLLQLLKTAIENELTALNNETALPLIAWRSRNILELAVWTGYCGKEEDNAKEFMLDSVRDLDGLLDMPQEVGGARTASFKAIRDELRRDAASDGLGMTDPFTQVSKAAKDIGRLTEFRYYNRVLSKFVHPTSLMVMNVLSEAIQDSCRKLCRQIGETQGRGAIGVIAKFLA
jgi:hypothetical protein